MADSTPKQDLPEVQPQQVVDVRDLVWETAYKILESGRYPTRNEICKALRKSSHTVGGYFAEWKKDNPRSTITVSQEKSEVHQSNNGNHSETREVASRSNLPSADEEVQYRTARNIASEHYYRKTWNFTAPGLREDLEDAVEQIDQYARRQDETLNPLGMLDYLMKRDYPES